MSEKPTYEELEKRIRELNRVEVEYSRLKKHFQESKENQKKTVQAVMDNIPGFAFIKDRNLNYVTANHTFCDLVKIPYNQIHGKTDYDIFPEDLAEKYIADDKKVIESGEPLFVEEETSDMNKDGQRFIVATRKHPWLDNNGQIIGIYALGFDISELKQTEDALRESEEKFKALFDQMPCGCAIYSVIGNGDNFIFKNFNKASEKIENLKKENLIGKLVTDIFPGVKRFGKFKIFQDVWKSGEMQYFPTACYKNYYDDDSDPGTWRESWIFKLSNGDIVSLYNDVSERKYAEIQNEKLKTQLAQSQKMEAIGTLAGGIAHDFNNMLGVITGNISYALSSLTKDNELYEVLADVQESSKQAQSLTNQLLTFSKGGAPIKKPSNINKIIRDAAIFSIRGAQSKCDFKLSENLWPSEVDEGQINQVINNLVINANQAMPNGGAIVISTENVGIETESGIPLPAGKYIKIGIEDQGVGISKNHLSNIFEPYFTTKQKGSGLGLATTYSIVKRHDGHITVYSEIEKGTVFNIYLPASLNDYRESKDQKETIHKGQGKILVMDDQEPILKMLGRMLHRMGYETVFATDGSQAVEIYNNAQTSEKSIDAVILDLTVPGGMGGLKTIIELLKIDPHVKAVVSSGYSNDPIMSNYEDYGFCGIVPKPYTKAQLAEVLNKVFDGKG